MRLLGAILLLLLTSGSVGAGVVVLEPAAEAEPADDLAILQLFLDRIAGLDGPLFDASDLPPSGCDRTRQPRTHGLFIGADEWADDSYWWLTGAENDGELFRNTLIARGAGPELLTVLAGPDATHAGVARAARSLLERVGCGDSVILQFSGYAWDTRLLGLPAGDGGPFNFEDKAFSMADLIGSVLEPGVADRIAADAPYAVLNTRGRGYGDVLSAGALSELVTLVRNRGADAVVVLDTASAAAFALEQRQAAVDPSVFSRLELAGELCVTETSLPSPVDVPCAVREGWTPTQLLPTAGELTVFYGTARGDPGIETKLPAGTQNPNVYGLFSFQLASALARADRTTAGALARRIADQPEEQLRRQSYSFVATDPDLDLIAEDRPERPPQAGQIVIDTPETTRSAAPLAGPEIAIAGRVVARGLPISVEVNGRRAALTSETGFETTLELQAGVNAVEIFAVTRQNEAITHRFELYYEGDIRAVIGEGRRYAVLIANQDYAEGSGLTDLKTPVGDAEALARLLRTRYGFVTEAALPGGGALNLFLKNAGQRETGLLFDQLARVVGERDSVLVFYAGHGEYEARGTAYWLPADALAGAYSTFIDAGDITRSLNRLAAKNVLVISDSCYSGMLLRGTETVAAPEADDDRLRALQRLAEKRSRVVISSGGNEPVLDAGADGHSVFADALLRALEHPEHGAFSARELFARLVPAVASRADQTPDFRPIHGAGHEGGDFVFLATDG